MAPKARTTTKPGGDDDYICNYDTSGGYPEPREIDPVTRKPLPAKSPWSPVRKAVRLPRKTVMWPYDDRLAPSPKRTAKAGGDDGYLGSYDTSGGYPEPRGIDPVTRKPLPDRYPTGDAPSRAVVSPYDEPALAPSCLWPNGSSLDEITICNARQKRATIEEVPSEPEDDLLDVETSGGIGRRTQISLLKAQAEAIFIASDTLGAHYPDLGKAISELVRQVGRVEALEGIKLRRRNRQAREARRIVSKATAMANSLGKSGPVKKSTSAGKGSKSTKKAASKAAIQATGRRTRSSAV
ncbi:hypothetical protein CLAFUW4_05469 [Fulvia fulva]|uniref:Uncharacterized protein n=1 Tax=Passalora fulva TaxID=5499 RepID=A0A9Q8LJ87_PASFU|nr:uncharacterized protein CLAFUR5_05612 [Fulvia fulva]KAK4624712.1 hypothetical protein CLAFUR4_05463 [Fulvia fulva]KAK4625735.1 hypothetical protein CLAFUR0_05471 [Fulvia fulva]UJO17603.1 hypothetical protein CLAFUR5_05612 [Fulvia fulva]WPV14555.1 hypothetical protein CLAFUW4_05469 [Fulvia fulva]WPV30277.1 hypothetical protein CLAFUW7_05467 [Fulvia fulva]